MRGTDLSKDCEVYDVALSFLAEDETLASRLHELLSERLRAFLYSYEQRKLAGKDGEAVFNQEFGSETRVVVVLYRHGWGDTPWTRIEKTAIKNRAYEQGYDFVLLVPLDKPPSAPNWLPKNRIWIGLERWGIDGAAGVIEARVQESGGELRPETAVVRAARVDREMRENREKKAFFESPEGVREAAEECRALLNALAELAHEIGETASGIRVSAQSDQRRCVIWANALSLHVAWRPQYTNTLADAKLVVHIAVGNVDLNGHMMWDQPEVLSKLEFDFDRELEGSTGWRSAGSPARFYSSSDLADELLKRLLAEVKKRGK